MPPKARNSKPGTSPAAGPPKMRSSCEACADSKIGCTKERPTCSRCERRDVPCVYVVTKRAGRPAKNKQREQSIPTRVNGEGSPEVSLQSSASPTSGSLSAGWTNDMTDTTMTDTTTSDTTSIYMPPPNMRQQSLDWSLSEFSGLFKSMPTSAADESQLVSPLPSLTEPLSQLLTASTPMSLLEDNRSINWDSFLFQPSTGNGSKSVQNFEDIWSNGLVGGDLNSEIPIASNSQRPVAAPTVWSNALGGGDINNEVPIPSNSRCTVATPTDSIDWFAVTDASNTASQAPTSDLSASQARPLPSPPLSCNKSSSRGCLARSLCLLDQLTPQWAATSCTRNKEKSSAPTSVSFESVIAQNQAAIDAVDGMLKCPCSRNSVLLSTIFLITCNMLGWYAACADAARRAPIEENLDTTESMISISSLGRRPPIVCRPLQSTMRDYETDVDNEDRIVCQIVLSRLYSVRRTLNVLTQRMTESEEKLGNPSSSTNRVSTATVDLLLDGPALNSSSSTSLGQTLANNLRCHLHELCENIVRTLSAM